jgi:hypothetical protein
MAELAREEPQRAGHVRDARGRSVRPLDPTAMRLVRRGEGIPADLLKEMSGRIGMRMTWRESWLVGPPRVTRCVMFGQVVLVGVLVTVGPLAIIRRPDFGSVTSYLFILCATVFSLYALRTAARRTFARRAADVMLEYVRCPYCGYNLRLLRADPLDGATVCPECGCAWRLDDHSRSDGERDDARGAPRESGAGKAEGNASG